MFPAGMYLANTLFTMQTKIDLHFILCVSQFLCLPLLEISSLMGYQCCTFFVANIVHDIGNTDTEN